MCLTRNSVPSKAEREQFLAYAENINLSMRSIAKSVLHTRHDIEARTQLLYGTESYRHFSPAAVAMKTKKTGEDIDVNGREPILVFQVVSRAKGYVMPSDDRLYYAESRAILGAFSLEDGKLKKKTVQSKLLKEGGLEELKQVFSLLFCMSMAVIKPAVQPAVFDYLVVDVVSEPELHANTSEPGFQSIIISWQLLKIALHTLRTIGVIM